MFNVYLVFVATKIAASTFHIVGIGRKTDYMWSEWIQVDIQVW